MFVFNYIFIIFLTSQTNSTLNEITLTRDKTRTPKSSKCLCFKDCITPICIKLRESLKSIIKPLKRLNRNRRAYDNSPYKTSKFSGNSSNKLGSIKGSFDRSPISPMFKTKSGLESFYFRTNMIENVPSSFIGDTLNKNNIPWFKAKNKITLINNTRHSNIRNQPISNNDEITTQIRAEISKLETSKRIIEDDINKNIFVNHSESEEKLKKIEERLLEYTNIENEYISKLEKLEMIKEKTQQIQKENKTQFCAWLKRICLPKTKQEEVKFIKDSLNAILEYKMVIKSNQIYLKATESLINKMVRRLTKERLELQCEIEQEEQNNIEQGNLEMSFVDTNKAVYHEELESINRNEIEEVADEYNVYLKNYEKNEYRIFDEEEQYKQYLYDMDKRINKVNKLENEVTEIKKIIFKDTKELQVLTKNLYNSKYVTNKLKNFDFNEEIQNYGVTALKALNRKVRLKTECSKIEEDSSVGNSTREIRKLKIETKFILKSLQDI